MIALKIGTSGRLQQIQAGETLNVDRIERQSGSGNIQIGASLSAADELQLGSASDLTRVMGDFIVDGQLDDDLAAGNNSILGIKVLGSDSEVNAGNSGSSITITWANGMKQRVTLNSATVTVTHTFPAVGNYILVIIQDASTQCTALTFAVTGGAARYPGGTLNVSGGASEVTLVAAYYDGTNAYFTYSEDMVTGSIAIT